MTVLNATRDRKERIGRLVRMHANTREDVSEVYAGDIAAIVGLKDTKTGDTLCDDKKPVLLENISFPEPVISIAIEPKTKVRSGQTLDRACQAGERRPDVPRGDRSGNRADHSERAWANCTLTSR